MREDGLSYRITGERDIATRLPGAVRAVTAAVTNGGGAPSAVDHAAALAKQQAEERRRAEVAAAEAVAAAAAKRAAEADAHVDTGFGLVAAAGPKPGAGVVIDVMPNKVETATGLVEAGSANLGQTTAPVGTVAGTVADVGAEPGIADEDLDARVAAMLAR
jgi:hypothetical protein